MRECVQCGEAFEPNKYTPNIQKHCSGSCRDRARYRGKRRKRQIQVETAWASENRDRYRANAKRSYENNRASRIAFTMECHKKNPEILARSQKKYRQRHAGTVNAKNSARQARQLQAVPKWADLGKIKQFYESCPSGHHVDHIIPLRGKNVCGLHCENNLQFLPAAENMAKGNRLV